MQLTILSVLEGLLLATAVSTDAFVSSFAYGTNRIRIPFRSMAIIGFICSLLLALSMAVGSLAGEALPAHLAGIIAFTLLFFLGIIKLFDSVIKRLIQKNSQLKKKISFSVFSLRFILHIYANPEAADKDDSRVLAPGEAVALALALSIDSLAVGIGAGMGQSNLVLILLLTFLCTILAVLSGSFFGNQLAKRIPVNLSWLSGVLLIILAFMNL